MSEETFMDKVKEIPSKITEKVKSVFTSDKEKPHEYADSVCKIESFSGDVYTVETLKKDDDDFNSYRNLPSSVRRSSNILTGLPEGWVAPESIVSPPDDHPKYPNEIENFPEHSQTTDGFPGVPLKEVFMDIPLPTVGVANSEESHRGIDTAVPLDNEAKEEKLCKEGDISGTELFKKPVHSSGDVSLQSDGDTSSHDSNDSFIDRVKELPSKITEKVKSVLTSDNERPHEYADPVNIESLSGDAYSVERIGEDDIDTTQVYPTARRNSNVLTGLPMKRDLINQEGWLTAEVLAAHNEDCSEKTTPLAQTPEESTGHKKTDEDASSKDSNDSFIDKVKELPTKITDKVKSVFTADNERPHEYADNVDIASLSGDVYTVEKIEEDESDTSQGYPTARRNSDVLTGLTQKPDLSDRKGSLMDEVLAAHTDEYLEYPDSAEEFQVIPQTTEGFTGLPPNEELACISQPDSGIKLSEESQETVEGEDTLQKEDDISETELPRKLILETGDDDIEQPSETEGLTDDQEEKELFFPQLSEEDKGPLLEGEGFSPPGDGYLSSVDNPFKTDLDDDILPGSEKLLDLPGDALLEKTGEVTELPDPVEAFILDDQSDDSGSHSTEQSPGASNMELRREGSSDTSEELQDLSVSTGFTKHQHTREAIHGHNHARITEVMEHPPGEGSLGKGFTHGSDMVHTPLEHRRLECGLSQDKDMEHLSGDDPLGNGPFHDMAIPPEDDLVSNDSPITVRPADDRAHRTNLIAAVIKQERAGMEKDTPQMDGLIGDFNSMEPHDRDAFVQKSMNEALLNCGNLAGVVHKDDMFKMSPAH